MSSNEEINTEINTDTYIDPNLDIQKQLENLENFENLQNLETLANLETISDIDTDLYPSDISSNCSIDENTINDKEKNDNLMDKWECPICMEEFKFKNSNDKEGKIIQCAQCQNELCFPCLTKWFEQCSSRQVHTNNNNTKCPYCNFDLIEVDDENTPHIDNSELVREIIIQNNGRSLSIPINNARTIYNIDDDQERYLREIMIQQNQARRRRFTEQESERQHFRTFTFQNKFFKFIGMGLLALGGIYLITIIIS